MRGPLRGVQEEEDEELGRVADAMFADEPPPPSPPSRPVPPTYEPAARAVEGHREDSLGEVARRYGDDDEEEEEGGGATMGPLDMRMGAEGGPLGSGEGGRGEGAASGVQAGQDTGDEVG